MNYTTYFSPRTQSAYTVSQDGEELIIFSGYSPSPEQSAWGGSPSLSLSTMEIVGEKGTQVEIPIKAPGTEHGRFHPYSSRHDSAVTLSSGMFMSVS